MQPPRCCCHVVFLSYVLLIAGMFADTGLALTWWWACSFFAVTTSCFSTTGLCRRSACAYPLTEGYPGTFPNVRRTTKSIAAVDWNYVVASTVVVLWVSWYRNVFMICECIPHSMTILWNSHIWDHMKFYEHTTVLVCTVSCRIVSMISSLSQYVLIICSKFNIVVPMITHDTYNCCAWATQRLIL